MTLSEDENDNIPDINTNFSKMVPELFLHLSEGGPMMTSLSAFLKDMNSANKAVTINPSHLFGQVDIVPLRMSSLFIIKNYVSYFEYR